MAKKYLVDLDEFEKEINRLSKRASLFQGFDPYTERIDKDDIIRLIKRLKNRNKQNKLKEVM